MFDDFRYALRLLYKAPAFTALVLLVMTGGLSISIYMASLMNTLVFKDLPFPKSENIVVIDKMLHGMRFDWGQLPAADLLAIDEQNSSFDDLLFYQQFFVNINVGETAKRIQALNIDPGGFEFTNTLPLLGRTLKKEDIRKGALGDAVISYKLWSEHFALDKLVIGKTMQINNQTVTVVGVMPEGYSFPYYSDIWFAFGRQYITREQFSNVAGLAKLKDDVSLQAANQDIARIMLRLSQQYPNSNYGVSAYVETLQKQALGSQSMPAIYALMGATVFVLLLSCVNVGGLLLSKALERANETAIRRSLGALRYRLILQMLWESAIICIISGLFALLIASWALQLTNPIFAQISYSQPLYWWVFGIDKQTIIATIIIVISTIFIAGFLPCWKATGGNFSDILRQGTRGATNQRVGRLSQLLIQVEVGLSVMILVVSAMFVINTLQSNQHLHQFDENKLLTFTIDLPYQHYQDVEQRQQFFTSLEQGLENLAGIENVAMGSSIPGNLAWVTEVTRLGEENSLEQIYANTVFVNQDLFSVFNISPMEGRLFANSDNKSAKTVAVISESLANTLWPNESAIGKKITLMTIQRMQVEVIGIIKHIDHGTSAFASSKKGGIYLVNGQLNDTFNTVMVKFQGDQATQVENISKVLYQLNSSVPAFNIMSYERMLDKNLTGVNFGSQLFAILAFIALLLAASGIYGVTANSINQRCREIGIRRALGASKQQVLLYFIQKVMGKLIIALLLGGLIALLLCYYLLSAFLISNTLMLTLLAIVISVITVVIIVAVIAPLMRILKEQPAFALRAE
jgi:putative ABC transport system permease protein